jgi:RNA polymerase sigma-70 factor (ECF subfamily)
MASNFRERGRWVARNVLPHEPLIRARLKRAYARGLEIDDVIQEMYTRILAVPSLESIRFPVQYAIRTAKSVIIDHIRRSQVVSIVSSGNLEQLDIPAPEVGVQERMEFQEEIREVASEIAKLPEVCRETLILRRVEGLSQKETAERLKISENSVEYYMTRGVFLLIQRFGRGRKGRIRSSTVFEEAEVDDENFKSGD